MTDTTPYTIIALLLLQALWKVPTALRGQIPERSLWAAVTTLTVAWFLRTDLGRYLTDGPGVVGLGTSLKHSLAVIGLTALAPVRRGRRPARPPGRHRMRILRGSGPRRAWPDDFYRL
ncbi:hypothetical protein ACFXKG_05430 [Streptomyces sp. NPDC059255]|uniref:hypothetical protein n=1 Tax=Streptomyces sp. NPDC059255 TaxID=3346793 RepID=UPI0036BC336B